MVFTEYRDTQIWLAGTARRPRLGGDRLGLLYGGMDPAQREHLKAAFQASPRTGTRSVSCWPPTRPAKASTCTSTATGSSTTTSRSTRTGSSSGSAGSTGTARPRPVAGQRTSSAPGWETAGAGSYEADLEFLSRVAAEGRPGARGPRHGSTRSWPTPSRRGCSGGIDAYVDPLAVRPKARRSAAGRTGPTVAQVARLRASWTPASRSCTSPPPTSSASSTPPSTLAGATAEPLVERTRRADRAAGPQARARDRTAGKARRTRSSPAARPHHLRRGDRQGPARRRARPPRHPLVDQSRPVCCAARCGSGQTGLHRVTGVIRDRPDDVRASRPLVTVFARFVLVGADGIRLHEEVLYAGRCAAARRHGPPRRGLERTPLRAILDRRSNRALDPDAAGSRARPPRHPRRPNGPARRRCSPATSQPAPTTRNAALQREAGPPPRGRALPDAPTRSFEPACARHLADGAGRAGATVSWPSTKSMTTEMAAVRRDRERMAGHDSTAWTPNATGNWTAAPRRYESVARTGLPRRGRLRVTRPEAGR